MQKLVLKRSTCVAPSPTCTPPATIKLVQDGKIDLKPFITRGSAHDLVEDGLGTSSPQGHRVKSSFTHKGAGCGIRRRWVAASMSRIVSEIVR